MKPKDPINRLISAFAKLPGIGERTATRLAFHVLNEPEALAKELAESLVEVKERVGMCQRCCNLTESSLCSICLEQRRDQRLVCVVESTQDLRAIERTADYSGVYHVLHGALSPLDGIGPDDVRIRELLARLPVDASPSPSSTSLNASVQDQEVREVILATSPSVDGEATALYLTRLLKPLGVRVSRIASGVPIGGELEYVDRLTLSRAISQRREV